MKPIMPDRAIESCGTWHDPQRKTAALETQLYPIKG